MWKTSLAIILLGGLFVSGCSSKIQPVKSAKAQIGYKTQSHLELRALPQPAQPIHVVVYKFRDQTGQYKPGTGTTGWSTAVTQGATSMLIKSLQDAGDGKWFEVLERESLNNLLNERKIIRQTRKEYDAAKQGGGVLLLLVILFGVLRPMMKNLVNRDLAEQIDGGL